MVKNAFSFIFCICIDSEVNARWDIMNDFLVILTTKSLIIPHHYVVKLPVSATHSPWDLSKPKK